MDIGKSVGYVFEDENWLTKVLVGGVIGLIPIVDLAILGYAVRTLQNVVKGSERPLPEWDDFGDYFVKGLMVFIGAFIYALPVIVLYAAVVIGANLTDARYLGNVMRPAVGMMVCLLVLYSFVLRLWLPAVVANYAVKGNLGAFFQFGEIWGLIANNLGDYVIFLVVSVVVGFVAGIVGFVLCIVGLAFTSFIEYLIYAHLLGQIVRQRQQPAVVPAV